MEERIINISRKLKLPIQGHQDIAFIDIDEKNDTNLYIDPYVIQALPGEFCAKARKCIDSFFKEVFKACRKQDSKRVRELLKYASEPNETNLGMKKISDYGKGATSEELTSLFLEFYKIVCKNTYTESNPLALCMYIQNFDKDKMSDLITNITRHLLLEFTVEQCTLWNIALSEGTSLIGYSWDCDECSWKALQGSTLIIDNKELLLVPKEIVRSRYVFNVECYIKQYILKTMQKDHADQNTDMCSIKEYVDGRRVVVPPTRDELYKQQVHGTVHKNYAFTSSFQNKTGEEDFINDILNRIQNGYGSLSDLQLDEIVYNLQKSKVC